MIQKSSYFPAFIKLDDKKVLLVGGGKIAYEKLTKLLDFTQDIKIIAPKISSDILTLIVKHTLSYSKREYIKDDIKECSLVVVAVDDLTLQKEIFLESQDYKCLCNSVDSVKYCDFIFPSYIKEDDLTVAISTSGASPAFAKHFKRYLKEKIPQSIGAFLIEMKGLRSSIPKGVERMKILDKKAREFIDSLG
ncbi:MAG TPA: bifunctional precorrin-2 dehydrogenase/sirohydrochlorin ferrochelatase [Sulfurimonas sp.]|nr:bifunctional precorrin-2 dehydrogenase/sirohydrochlorin ferrochelatase [Sulfurimonas sp.]